MVSSLTTDTLVTRSTRLLKADFWVGAKEQHFLPAADVVAPAPGTLPARSDEDKERVAVEDLVRSLAGDQLGQLPIGEPLVRLPGTAWSKRIQMSKNVGVIL